MQHNSLAATMPHITRGLQGSARSRCALAAACGLFALGSASTASAQRSLGLDVSDWQGSLSQSNWNSIRAAGKDFAFIRSTRGGTTGTYNENTGVGTLSAKYDDLYFTNNMNRATTAGLVVGSYHFARPDILTNTGADEAQHMLNVAGAFMKPGYMRPVLDLEAGNTQRTRAELSAFAVEFANTIYAAKGVYPIVYVNGSYANDEVDTSVPAVMPDVWIARWPTSPNPQTQDPPGTASYPNIYGVWNPNYPSTTLPNPQPWQFWQYTSTGTVSGISGNVDLDVAHGDIDYVKDFMVPAIWQPNTDGPWITAANWNSSPSLPGTNDQVIINRASADPLVTLARGTQNIRRLTVGDRLTVSGGTLNVSKTSVINGTLTYSGGAITTDTLAFAAGAAFSMTAPLTLSARQISLATDFAFTGASGTGQFSAPGGAISPMLDLAGGSRTLTIGDGSGATDFQINLPVTGGTLIKAGAGTLVLATTSSSTANVTVANGYLRLTANGQLGSGAVATQMTVTTPGSAGYGGTIQLTGGLSFSNALTIGGGGIVGVNATVPGTTGALDNTSGNNTWSGTITLAGTGFNGNDPLENQIGSTAGTLTLSGVIQNASGVEATWAKTGAGDVVLTGASANTYTGMTRLFGGRLIIEKDGALGAAGSSTLANGNTFQLANSASVIAFRAPGASAGFTYNAAEWIHTSGAGSGGLGQIDNLGGDNLFKGHVGLGGPTIGPNIVAYLGVSAGSLELAGGIYARGADAGVRTINKLGAGTLIISGNSASPPTNGSDVALSNSTVAISAGTLRLKGNLPGVTVWSVASGATLDNSAGAALTGGVSVSGGAAYINTGGSAVLTSLGGAGSVAVSAGTVLTQAVVASPLSLSGTGQLTIAVGGLGGVASALTITGPSRLDLSDNGFVIDYAGAVGTRRADTMALVASGRNGFDANTVTLWNGAGIVSGTARTQSVAAGFDLFGVGVINNADLTDPNIGRDTYTTFDARIVDSSSILLRYTYCGDADLNGFVDGDDYALIDNTYNGLIPNFGWLSGDFNYDGLIDGDDYALIDSGYLFQGAPIAASALAVPEPGVLGTLAIALALEGRRRRR